MKIVAAPIHPHDLWRQAHRLPTKLWVAQKLGISTGHLSSIYKGDFRPSERLAWRMAAITRGARSTKEILRWHRTRRPIWERVGGNGSASQLKAPRAGSDRRGAGR